MEELPYYDKYLKQDSKCSICGKEITSEEYCVVNTPEGIRIVHRQCKGNVKIGGCYAQIEVIYEDNK